MIHSSSSFWHLWLQQGLRLTWRQKALFVVGCFVFVEVPQQKKHCPCARSNSEQVNQVCAVILSQAVEKLFDLSVSQDSSCAIHVVDVWSDELPSTRGHAHPISIFRGRSLLPPRNRSRRFSRRLPQSIPQARRGLAPRQALHFLRGRG